MIEVYCPPPYFVPTGDPIGGANFTSLATGLNFALLGWKAFQSEIVACENRLESRVLSSSASLDESDKAFFVSLCIWFLNMFKGYRAAAWKVSYFLAVIGMACGVAMLFEGIASPYGLILMLPLTMRVFITWIPLYGLIAWMRIGTSIMKTLSKYRKAQAGIKSFALEAGKQVSDVDKRS